MEMRRENIDFDKVLMTMTPEEIIAWEDKAKSYKQKSLDRRVAELELREKQTMAELALLKEANVVLKEDSIIFKNDITIIKEKTDVLEFEDNTTMGVIKKQAKNRITYLLGDGTAQYTVLFRTCIANLYGSISGALCGGKRIGKIKVEDGASAITMAKRYNLNNKSINKKIQTLRKEQEQGLLSKEKSIALDLTAEWMEERIYG